jgi:hypothetical protein
MDAFTFRHGVEFCAGFGFDSKITFGRFKLYVEGFIPYDCIFRSFHCITVPVNCEKVKCTRVARVHFEA